MPRRHHLRPPTPAAPSPLRRCRGGSAAGVRGGRDRPAPATEHQRRLLLFEQLRAALQSRVVIEQAKGVLAEYLNVTVDETFRQLRNHARKLTDLARDVAPDILEPTPSPHPRH